MIQTGLYLSASGPSYVYVRFRCGRCKRVGEQLVQESNWDPGVLQHTEVRMSEDELRRFSEMGDISAEEVIAFHYGLDRPASGDRVRRIDVGVAEPSYGGVDATAEAALDPAFFVRWRGGKRQRPY